MNDLEARFYLNLIKGSIEEFQTGKVDLGKLISNLESTIETLKQASYKDADQMWESWGVLEEIYATGLSIRRTDASYSCLTDPDVAETLLAEIVKIRKLCL